MRNGPAVACTFCCAAAATLLLGGPSSGAAQLRDPQISARQAAQQTSFSDQDISDGFFKIAFRGELQLDRPAERIRKFDAPVRVFIVNRGSPDRRTEIAEVVADIRAHVAHLDIAVTARRQVANLVVTLVRSRDMARTIRSYYGPEVAARIQKRLKPQCLSGIGKDENYRIRRAEVILPTDVEDFPFADCAYEELLQGLGLINDDSSVPWTMFNDQVQMGFFDIYDQYLVNLLYDPRIRPGMTKDEVTQLLPSALADVRAWVTPSQCAQTSELMPSCGIPASRRHGQAGDRRFNLKQARSSASHPWRSAPTRTKIP
jgi:hypothetical protein